MIKKQIEPGSVKASIFSLIIICLGAGTLGIPYVYYANGYILGTFDILFGGAISMYTGYLIAYCAEKTNGTCYEEIAFACYGKKGQVFTSFCMVLCNLGFTVGYIVLFKTFMPYVIEEITGNDLPHWCNNTKNG
jgi:amino acid permease